MSERTVTRREAAESTRRTAHARRSLLKLRGVDERVIAATPDAELLALLPTPLTLVPNIDDEPPIAASMVTEVMPRLTVEWDEQTPDELESTRLAWSRLRGERTELRNVPTGASFFGLGGYDGDAA